MIINNNGNIDNQIYDNEEEGNEEKENENKLKILGKILIRIIEEIGKNNKNKNEE